MTHVSELVLIANASDGTISSLRLHRGESPRLEVLTTTEGLTGCGTFAVDTRRTLLLGASYGGNVGGTWPVRVDTEPDAGPDSQPGLGEPVARIEHRNLHCVVPSDAPEGTDSAPTVAYFVALGDDLIAQYSVESDGALTPLDPPTVAAPAGSGPRHLLLDGDNAYLVTEYSGELIRFARGSDGALRTAGTGPTRLRSTSSGAPTCTAPDTGSSPPSAVRRC